MTKGTIKYVKGNVCEPQVAENEVPVIPHCCNNLGRMGAGVALALKKKWPGVEIYYRKGVMALGAISSWMEFTSEIEPPNRTPKFIVFNMIGQDGVRGPENPRPVKYWALVKAMQDVFNKVDAFSLAYPQKEFVFHCPKFGSDLAGGKWELIEELIQELWVDKGFNVVVYEFEADPEKWGPIE